MKKIILATVSFLLITATYSYGISDTEFVGAKGKLLFSYKTLETNATQISLIFEQEAEEMSHKEQSVLHIVRGDLELGMFTIREILGLYTLQGVQVSTPPEARKLLINASLDSIDYLNGIQERLRVRGVSISNDKTRKVMTESLLIIEEAKEAIRILQEAIENLSKKPASLSGQ